MTTDADFEDEDSGHVMVSFDVFSPTPIQNLERHASSKGAIPDEYRYDFGTTTFDEPAWEARADKLEAAINAHLDHLASVPREQLHAPDVFVRLFLTLPHGAETLPAATVQRLADVNATIWIDA